VPGREAVAIQRQHRGTEDWSRLSVAVSWYRRAIAGKRLFHHENQILTAISMYAIKTLT
jgi:hypothetical protein